MARQGTSGLVGMDPPDDQPDDFPRRSISEPAGSRREVPEHPQGLPRPELEPPNPSLSMFDPARAVQVGGQVQHRFLQHSGEAQRASGLVHPGGAEPDPQLGSGVAGDVRKKRGKKEGESGVKKRARKPPDSPRRPKSAYMFFLAEFREQWKAQHPENRKVADVAKAAGERWRAMSDAEKARYEELSTESKAQYAREMEVYRSTKERSKGGRPSGGESPGESSQEQNPYHYFLRDFREAYKKEHPDEQPDARTIAKQAAETWKSMTPEERYPFEKMVQDVSIGGFTPVPQLFSTYPSGALGGSIDVHVVPTAPLPQSTTSSHLEAFGRPHMSPGQIFPSGGQEASDRKGGINPPFSSPPE